MKNHPSFHSNAPSNPSALYPRAVNSPLRYDIQSIADDESGDDESIADEEHSDNE
jgi:hypothetical protein